MNSEIFHSKLLVCQRVENADKHLLQMIPFDIAQVMMIGRIVTFLKGVFLSAIHLHYQLFVDATV